MRNFASQHQKEVKEFDEKVVQVNRVSKKTKGGNQMGFSVLVVVGNKKGKVGVGLGKAKDVSSAVQKGVKKAKRRLVEVPMNGATIPFALNVKFGAAHIMLKPAPVGSGIIAGGAVRAVVDAAGIRDISSKIKGTSNKASNVYATLEALKQMRDIVKNKNIVLKSIADIEKEEKEALREQAAKQKEAAKKNEEKFVKREKRVEKKAEVKVVEKVVEKVAAPKVEAPKAEVKSETKKEEVKKATSKEEVKVAPKNEEVKAEEPKTETLKVGVKSEASKVN